MNGRRIVVTGGAGFIGGHLCRALLGRGFDVVAVDDLSSGRPSNVPAGVELVVRDVSRHELTDLGPVVAVAHLASPASPADYLARPLDTLRTGSEGTRHAAELDRKSVV